MHLVLRSIVKTFPGVVANDGVDFAVGPGEVHALLGENGAGKSTLMNVLFGLQQPDAGTISIDGTEVPMTGPSVAIRHGIGMVHQDFLLIDRMTVLENVMVGVRSGIGAGRLNTIDRAAVRERLVALSDQYGLGILPDARIETLSVGEQQRVEILKQLFRGAEVLILDEPTAVLGPLEAEGLFEVVRAIREAGGTVVMITHKMHEVIAHTDRVTVMRAGKVVAEHATADTNERELARLMMGDTLGERRHNTTENRTDDSVVLKVDRAVVVDAEGVERVKGVSLELTAGEVIGIAGVDGNGQRELAELIIGLNRPRHGRVLMDGVEIHGHDVAKHRRLGIRYVPADRRGVGSIGGLSITDNVVLGCAWRYSQGGFLRRAASTEAAERIVERFRVRTPNIGFFAGNLSGGNLQKVILGRELDGAPRVLVVEQPTRGLDVGATVQIRNALVEAATRGIAVLVISVDLDELMEVSDRVAVMFDGHLTAPIATANLTTEQLGLLMSGVAA